MEVTQITLLIVVATLTLMLTIMGFQVVKILAEFKKTVEKINQILDNLTLITENVARPTAVLPTALEGLKTALKIFGSFVHRQKNEKDNQ